MARMTSTSNENYVCVYIYILENPVIYELMWKIMVRYTQATDDNIIPRIRIACWINKRIDTHFSFLLILFHGNNCYANAHKCMYIARFVTFGPVTAYSFIVTLVTRQRTQNARAERDANFGTFTVSCDTLSADDTPTTRRGLCQWPCAWLKRITSLPAVEVCLIEILCLNDRRRLVSRLFNGGSRRSSARS